MVIVKFTITNSAAVANLKLRVNSTAAADAIPIKCQIAATISNLPAVGYLQTNRPYTFVYDGVNWVMMNVNRDNNDNTLVRTYALTTTTELPLLAGSQTTGGAWSSEYTSSYKNLYGTIPSVVANRAMLNPSTGHITVPGGITTKLTTLETSGYSMDQHGNFTHGRTTTDDCWRINKNNGSAVFEVYWENGNVTSQGTITATGGFSGDVSGNATSATRINGNFPSVSDSDTIARNLIVGGDDSGISGACKYNSGLWYRRSDKTLCLPTNTIISCSGCKIPISGGTGNIKHYVIGVPAYSASSQSLAVSPTVTVDNVGVYNAVWNDYAEYRLSITQEPGYAITPYGKKTTQRLEAGVRIISDTYGFSVGGDSDSINAAPVGLAGRVLAYPYRNKSEYKIGDVVCSAPNGMIDIMTREEIKEYPDRIIGIVNEIPNYDIWEPSRIDGNKIIHTNGRIWIDIK